MTSQVPNRMYLYLPYRNLNAMSLNFGFIAAEISAKA
jgi:hypothetical protein